MLKGNVPVIGLIFAGGMGERMEGARIPKQFLEIGGKSIIVRTIEHFQNHPLVDAVVVVCVESWIDAFLVQAKQFRLSKISKVVCGGATGQESIYNGLCAILDIESKESIVLVHDGVRPLIDEKTITRCVNSVFEKGCTATVAPAIETIIEEKDGRVNCVVDRANCRLARAPQGFWTNELIAAHIQAKKDKLSFIDSISLMAHYGYEIFTVDGPIENIKITSPRDFFVLKGYMDMKELSQLWEV